MVKHTTKLTEEFPKYAVHAYKKDMYGMQSLQAHNQKYIDLDVQFDPVEEIRYSRPISSFINTLAIKYYELKPSPNLPENTALIVYLEDAGGKESLLAEKLIKVDANGTESDGIAFVYDEEIGKWKSPRIDNFNKLKSLILVAIPSTFLN